MGRGHLKKHACFVWTNHPESVFFYDNHIPLKWHSKRYLNVFKERMKTAIFLCSVPKPPPHITNCHRKCQLHRWMLLKEIQTPVASVAFLWCPSFLLKEVQPDDFLLPCSLSLLVPDFREISAVRKTNLCFWVAQFLSTVKYFTPMCFWIHHKIIFAHWMSEIICNWSKKYK